MAEVNFFDHFELPWARNGTVEGITDSQWQAGWSFVGATPPSVEQFNKLQQMSDEKAAWLFRQLKAVAQRYQFDLTPESEDGVLLAVQGRLLNVVVFSAPGTAAYTPTPGTRHIVVEGVGGGGAGGGSATVGAAAVSFGGGGGGGGYFKSLLKEDFSGMSVTVGAGGVGVASAAGGNGASTSFGATLTAPGGQGGASGGVFASFPGLAGYGPGGAAGMGGSIVNASGGNGSFGFAGSAGSGISGYGGVSALGGGANPVVSTTSAGNPATSPGAGGSGALSVSSGTARPGGNGANGKVIIWEYS